MRAVLGATKRESLVSRLAIVLGRRDAEAAVREIESTVSDAASRAARDVVIKGLVASALIGFFAGRIGGR